MEPLLQYIEKRQIAGSLKEQLLSLQSEERAVVEGIAVELNPSANSLRDLLRLATEIAARDDSTLRQVCESQPLEELRANADLGPKDKLQKIKAVLEGVRYPERARLYEELEQRKKKIAREFGLRVELPKDLEGDSLQLTLSARSADEFKQSAAALLAASEGAEMAQLFQILKGVG